MSGLGAIYNADATPVSRDSMERMTNALRLHGPKKQAFKVIRNCGLCWTDGAPFVPEDINDRQPITTGGRWSLVFSGLLYFRNELAEKLNIDKLRAKALSDAALTHMAWQKWQADCLPHLYGNYCIFVSDLENNTLTVARSPLESLPVFYHTKGKRLAIATAPKGLFALGDIERRINETLIADALVLNQEDRESSFYKGLTNLPLGHVMVCGQNGISIKKHYDLNNASDVRFKKDEDYVEAAREIVRGCIDETMRTTTPPAASLSGGFDSSLVVVEALDHYKRNGKPDQKITTFTSVPCSGWDGTAFGRNRMGDESGSVKALANMYPQIDAQLIASEDLPLDHDYEKLMMLSEMPSLGINNLHWGLNLQYLARQGGFNVLLGGQSGNATVSRSGRYLFGKLFRQGRWLRLHRELKLANNEDARFYRFHQRALVPNLPRSVVQMIANVRGKGGLLGWRTHSAINPDYAGDMRTVERMKEMGWDDTYSGFSSPKKLMLHMLSSGSRNSGQPVRAAMETLTGIQLRDPLGSRKLIEFCAGVPDEQFLKNGDDRHLVTRVMAGRLPAEYFNSPRGRQSADWHYRLTRDLPRYKREIERMGDDPNMARRFDMPRLRKLMDTWPDKTPLSAQDHPDFRLARSGLMRSIAMSRFINWVEGKN